jgi:crotonobetainyl-CoA:carnitine CoA-transferase CaiB-like acyl-CoA transferase
MSLPLSGIRVLDAATVLAAPLSATLLAELGAEVIKVEQPGQGDPVRSYAPYADGVSLHWRVTGRNKKSVTLDLHVPEGVELFHRLVGVCDVVVTNFRPRKLREWNIDYDMLTRVKPDIVMLHLSAFGRSGPYTDRPGFARIAEAFSGLTYITGYADRTPVFAGYPIADGVAGFYGAFTILAALRHRDQTGEGQLIDLALYEPMLRMMEDFIVGYSGNGESKERQGNEQFNICPNNFYPTADGEYVILPVSTDQMWRRLVALIGDPRLSVYPTNQDRLRNRALIDRTVGDFTRRYHLEKLLTLFEEHGVASGKLYAVQDIFEDPQIEARGNLVEIDDEELGPLTVQAPIPHYSTITPQLTAAPRLGQHNDEVYRDLLHIDDQVLERYRAHGAI